MNIDDILNRLYQYLKIGQDLLAMLGMYTSLFLPLMQYNNYITYNTCTAHQTAKPQSFKPYDFRLTMATLPLTQGRDSLPLV